MGIPVIPVDGNDAVAVYRVVTESVARARQGRGPTLIDCRQWMDSNPIPNMEEYLTRKGLFRPDWKSQAEAEIDSQIAAAMSASVLPKTPSS